MAFTAQAGSLTWFNLGKATDPELLNAGLERMGLDGHSPARRTHLAAVKVAMSDVFSKAEELIRPLEKKRDNGYSVVVETKGKFQNDYTTIVRAKVDDDTGVVMCSVGEYQAELQRLTGYYRRVLPSSSVSAMMLDILRTLDGIAMKDNGGLYFIPEVNAARWDALAQLIESAGSPESPNTVTTQPLVLNASTLRDILRRITEEVTREADALRAEIASGELGTQALIARAQHASAVRERVELYEQMLNQPLVSCRQSLDTVIMAFSAAASMQDSADTFGDVFA